MIRPMTVATVIAACCAAIAAFGPNAATAASTSTNAKLSATEFTQLGASLTGLKQALATKNGNWGAASGACRKLGNSTPLLRTQRANCLATVATLHSLVSFAADQSRCSAKIAKSSKKSAIPAKLQLVACLNADYQKIGRLAGVMYAADQASNKQVNARGFTGICFDTLADTAAEVRNEEDFATSAKQLAADVAVMTRITKGSAAPTNINAKQIESDAQAFDAAAKKLLDENSPSKLDACPHD